jgi:hypothetical protein
VPWKSAFFCAAVPLSTPTSFEKVIISCQIRDDDDDDDDEDDDDDGQYHHRKMCWSQIIKVLCLYVLNVLLMFYIPTP